MKNLRALLLTPKIKSAVFLFGVQLFTVTLFSFAFRFYILANNPFDSWNTADVLIAFIKGFIFDFKVSLLFCAPTLFFVLINTKNEFSSRLRKFWLASVLFSLFAVGFNLFSEYFFFQEFKDRYNFIAVDYLVYTNEVLANIWESYNIAQYLTVIFILSIGGTYAVNKTSQEVSLVRSSFKTKITLLVSYIFLIIFSFFFIKEDYLLSNVSDQQTLVAKNGMVSLFTAYFKNEIKYDQYYTRMDSGLAEKKLLETMKSESNSLVSKIQTNQPVKKLNVVLVLMESLSAKYMGTYGGRENITPNLDRLTSESLFFSNAYSTGTRTVRGIEGVVLSVPPTPGQSIVRRPNNDKLFNIGSEFRARGYETNFVYGGNSFFDNMGAFFSGNEFGIIDIDNFKKDEITFSNAWGVCDEDLFNKTLSESDLAYNSKKPFFQFLLTTSNHRPYTYPEHIDIPSGTGRSGAVKYADFSIGQFLEKAKTKPWFDSTVFIFISDHNAAVAGSEHIDPSDYRIPIIIYSPKNIKPQNRTDLVSQIDLAPTLLGLLNFSYESKFLGKDLNQNQPERAFLGTYQKVAYMTNQEFVVLAPNHMVEEYQITENKAANLVQKASLSEVNSDTKDIIQTTVAYYKTTADWFYNGWFKKDYKPGSK